MSATGFTGIVVIVLFVGLMIFFMIISKDRKSDNIRPISGYQKILEEINVAVEDGSQLHISLGRGGISGPDAAAGLAGLSLLKQVIEKSSMCDHPPVASTGNAVLSILAQDTIQGTSKAISVSDQLKNPSGELVGVTPFSYAAGTLTTIRDDSVSANVYTGWFGNEVIWLTTASERQSSPTIAGTAQLPAQAIMYASASDPLIGEELYASGAYLGAGPMHMASISAQDVIRWIMIFLILISVLLNLVGINTFIEDILAGSM
ncbi:MAG: DUF6754 domain-containing protein [Anaerolineales bacterium]